MGNRIPRVRASLGGKLAATVAAVVFGLLGMSLDASPARASDSCVAHAVEAERELNIPTGLLVSIALVESGLEGAPYPYAMSINGRSVYAQGLDEAQKRLRDRRGELHANTFVGCMQLSVQAHRAHFSPVERIVSPKDNVWYAGRLLARLHAEEGNWRAAVARYNGSSMRRAAAYVCKVWSHLNEFARLLESAACESARPVIAPKTRRSVRDAQVALVN